MNARDEIKPYPICQFHRGIVRGCCLLREPQENVNGRLRRANAKIAIMALPIEDYALIGNLRTAALVGRDGSIDWLCVPRFDDAACFCALLGTPEHGRWLLAPARSVRRTTRRYRDQSLILETEFVTATGSVRVVDFMPTWGERTDVVRIVEGLRGRVAMRMELVLRFGYGSVIPWVRRVDGALLATGGPHSARGALPPSTPTARISARWRSSRSQAGSACRS